MYVDKYHVIYVILVCFLHVYMKTNFEVENFAQSEQMIWVKTLF